MPVSTFCMQDRPNVMSAHVPPCSRVRRRTVACVQQQVSAPARQGIVRHSHLNEEAVRLEDAAQPRILIRCALPILSPAHNRSSLNQCLGSGVF